MDPRRKEQIGGVFFILAGILVTYLGWVNAINTGWYLSKAAAFGPAAVVIGLGLILFPSYRKERMARGENFTRLKSIQLITPRWWTILVLALIAGFINLFFLGFFNF